jgi:hypothetical protein
VLSMRLLPFWDAQVDGDAPENQDVMQQLEVSQEPWLGAVGAWSACSLPAAQASAQAAIAPARSSGLPACVQCHSAFLPLPALACLQDGEFIQVELVPVHGLLQHLQVCRRLPSLPPGAPGTFGCSSWGRQHQRVHDPFTAGYIYLPCNTCIILVHSLESSVA